MLIHDRFLLGIKPKNRMHRLISGPRFPSDVINGTVEEVSPNPAAAALNTASVLPWSAVAKCLHPLGEVSR